MLNIEYITAAKILFINAAGEQRMYFPDTEVCYKKETSKKTVIGIHNSECSLIAKSGSRTMSYTFYNSTFLTDNPNKVSRTDNSLTVKVGTPRRLVNKRIKRPSADSIKLDHALALMEAVVNEECIKEASDFSLEFRSPLFSKIIPLNLTPSLSNVYSTRLKTFIVKSEVVNNKLSKIMRYTLVVHFNINNRYYVPVSYIFHALTSTSITIN